MVTTRRRRGRNPKNLIYDIIELRAFPVRSNSDEDSTGFQSSFILGAFLSLILAIAFILACIGVAMGQKNEANIAILKQQISRAEAADYCSTRGDTVWGVAPVKYNGHFYSLVGDPSASLTWHDARNDAQGRCYQGLQGYLVNIDSSDEDEFIFALMGGASSISGFSAWIGAADVTVEGTFSWIGPDNLDRPFYCSGVAVGGAYSHWAQGEPNEGGFKLLTEDCVSKYGGSFGSGVGSWNDQNCYVKNQYFVVEYGFDY